MVVRTYNKLSDMLRYSDAKADMAISLATFTFLAKISYQNMCVADAFLIGVGATAGLFKLGQIAAKKTGIKIGENPWSS